ncbi:hypothetical protein pb186bvf_015110 [Paramecium bursaria]
MLVIFMEKYTNLFTVIKLAFNLVIRSVNCVQKEYTNLIKQILFPFAQYSQIIIGLKSLYLYQGLLTLLIYIQCLLLLKHLFQKQNNSSQDMQLQIDITSIMLIYIRLYKINNPSLCNNREFQLFLYNNREKNIFKIHMIFQQNCTCFRKEDMTRILSNNQQYDICRYCHDQILLGKENFINAQLLKQHVNMKIQVVLEKQSVYKSLIQEYNKFQKSINDVITTIVDQLKLDINIMEQIIYQQQQISQELIKNEYIASSNQEAIKFMKSDIHIIPQDLRKLEKQLQIFEEELGQIKDLLQNIPHLEDLQVCQDILEQKPITKYFKYYKSYDIIEQLLFKQEVVDVQICQYTDYFAISFADNTFEIFDSFRIFKQCDFQNDCLISTMCIPEMENIDLMIGDQNGFIQIFQFLYEDNKDSEIQLNAIKKFRHHQDKILTIVQRNDNQAISCSLDDQIIVFDTDTGINLVKIKFQLTNLNNLAYNKRQNLLAIPNNKEITLWELENQSIQQQIQQTSLIDQEKQLQFSYDGIIFIQSLCRERKLQIFNMDKIKKHFIKTNTINFDSHIFNFTLKWTGPQIVVVTAQEILVIEYTDDQFQVLNKIEQTCPRFMPNIQRMDFKILLSYNNSSLFIYKIQDQ